MGAGVIVENRYRDEPSARAILHFANGGSAHVEAAHDCDPQTHLPGSALPRKQSRVESDDTHADGGEQAPDDDHTDRNELRTVHAPDEVESEQNGHCHQRS